jgi:protein-S-isoprenylcysteine O-methyltransferase Ste14
MGLTIATIGLVLWISARLQLGQSFTVRARATALVTTGLYSKIRHPIYLFGDLSQSSA